LVDARGPVKSNPSLRRGRNRETAAARITIIRLFILDKGKPAVRWGRKAMGPLGVARLSKG